MLILASNIIESILENNVLHDLIYISFIVAWFSFIINVVTVQLPAFNIPIKKMRILVQVERLVYRLYI